MESDDAFIDRMYKWFDYYCKVTDRGEVEEACPTADFERLLDLAWKYVGCSK